MTWYSQTEPELRKLCEDINERTAMQQRLEELRAVNYHGVRCVMSKALEEKLERVLADGQDTAKV